MQFGYDAEEGVDAVDAVAEDADALPLGAYQFAQCHHYIVGGYQVQFQAVVVVGTNQYAMEIAEAFVGSNDGCGRNERFVVETEEVVHRQFDGRAEVHVLYQFLAFVEKQETVVVHVEVELLHGFLNLGETLRGGKQFVRSIAVFFQKVDHACHRYAAHHRQTMGVFLRFALDNRHVGFYNDGFAGRFQFHIRGADARQLLVDDAVRGDKLFPGPLQGVYQMLVATDFVDSVVFHEK